MPSTKIDEQYTVTKRVYRAAGMLYATKNKQWIDNAVAKGKDDTVELLTPRVNTELVQDADWVNKYQDIFTNQVGLTAEELGGMLRKPPSEYFGQVLQKAMENPSSGALSIEFLDSCVTLAMAEYTLGRDEGKKWVNDLGRLHPMKAKAFFQLIEEKLYDLVGKFKYMKVEEGEGALSLVDQYGWSTAILNPKKGTVFDPTGKIKCKVKFLGLSKRYDADIPALNITGEASEAYTNFLRNLTPASEAQETGDGSLDSFFTEVTKLSAEQISPKTTQAQLPRTEYQKIFFLTKDNGYQGSRADPKFVADELQPPAKDAVQHLVGVEDQIIPFLLPIEAWKKDVVARMQNDIPGEANELKKSQLHEGIKSIPTKVSSTPIGYEPPAEVSQKMQEMYAILRAAKDNFEKFAITIPPDQKPVFKQVYRWFTRIETAFVFRATYELQSGMGQVPTSK